MLNHLRRPLAARVAAPVLLLGLVLAWAAPARAARVWAAEKSRAAELLTADDAARVEAALAEASHRAVSAEAFAAEVVRALAEGTGTGDVSPAADALLRALFGRMLQAMTLGRGSPAVAVAHNTTVIGGPALSPVPAPAPARGVSPPTSTDMVDAAESQGLVPREARPSIQSLGP